LVENKLFRGDLYYRLNVVPIHLPPLRERGYDIIILSRYYLNHYSEIYKKNVIGFTPQAEKLLMKYNYPGNIRELRNLIEYAIIFEENSHIGTKNIERKIGSSHEINNIKLADLTKAYEKSIISNRIQRLGNNLNSKKEAAKQLGISIATLYRKLED
jgi:transcriptional regulator with PAS, ATPase and Fis domain